MWEGSRTLGLILNRRHRYICAANLLVFVGFSALSGKAQERMEARVAIPLIAIDSHHRPANVAVEMLAIKDRNTSVTQAGLVRGSDLAVEMAILVDASASQHSVDLNDILRSATHFVSRNIRAPEDRVFYETFSATAQMTDWLKREQLPTAKVKLKIGGGTALYDALVMACKERMGPRDWHAPTRRIIVIISDGEDNLSHLRRDEAISEALKSGAVIFTVNTDLSGLSYRGAMNLEGLAEATGGESFNQVGSTEISRVFENVSEAMSEMYYLQYFPPVPSDSTTHQIEVKNVGREKFKLLYPKEYFWIQ